MAKGKGKGSSFEREVCTILSRWWSKGKRDDIFWRTSGSGARAKTRSKTKQLTFGQYGDVQATDPIGQPLIDLCTIELKRGYSKSTFANLIDHLDDAAEQSYEKFILQAITDNKNSSSYVWMLIVKRDRRKILVFIPHTFYKSLKAKKCTIGIPRFTLDCKFYDGKRRKIFGTTLDNFLACVQPKHFEEYCKAVAQRRL